MRRNRDSRLSLAELRRLLHYDPVSGLFTWKASRGRVAAGSTAGSTDKDGCVRISIDSHDYRASHLAYLWLTGALPSRGERIGYVDGDQSNTSATNLKLVPIEPWRRRFRGDSSGVVFDASKGKYRAVIRMGGRQVALGTYSTPEAAKAAYEIAKFARAEAQRRRPRSAGQGRQ